MLRSGKVAFAGLPVGKPFMYGKFAHQLHAITIKTSENGITYFKPKFIETIRTNNYLNISLNEITEDYLKDEIILDEENFKNITDENDEEFFLVSPAVIEGQVIDDEKDIDNKKRLGTQTLNDLLALKILSKRERIKIEDNKKRNNKKVESTMNNMDTFNSLLGDVKKMIFTQVDGTEDQKKFDEIEKKLNEEDEENAKNKLKILNCMRIGEKGNKEVNHNYLIKDEKELDGDYYFEYKGQNKVEDKKFHEKRAPIDEEGKSSLIRAQKNFKYFSTKLMEKNSCQIMQTIGAISKALCLDSIDITLDEKMKIYKILRDKKKSN
jgi:hypothetical protein